MFNCTTQNIFTIQDIFNKYGDEYAEKYKLSKEQWKVFNAIRRCGTGELGTHLIVCSECGETIIGYNSCRNRHCPMCQSYAREKWIKKEAENLLDCKYFHIVTTIPSELNELVMYNQELFYKILFKATSEAILELTKDPKWLGAKVGITSILHTWGQTMEYHPHIHSIVTGAGLADSGKWVECDKDYLIKVQVLGSLFRGKFLSMIKSIRKDIVFPDTLSYIVDDKTFNDFLRPLYNKTWITYIEPPKGSPENVIEYIGRYAFRVAISNNRIKSIDNHEITFEYKDYKDNSKIKLMTIDALEFIRRFMMHVLPCCFTKIKHYGLLSNSTKTKMLKLCRKLIIKIKRKTNIYKKNVKRVLHEFACPKCGCDKFNYYYNYKPHRSRCITC